MSRALIKCHPVFSTLRSQEAVALTRQHLYYEYDWWQDDPRGYGKKVVRRKRHLMGLKGGFLTGFVPRVYKILTQSGFGVEVRGYNNAEHRFQPVTKVDNMILRDDQLLLTHAAGKYGRGVLVAPTGAGKTVIAMAIIDSMPTRSILFLVPNKTLLVQTHSRFREVFSGEEIGMMGAGIEDPQRITVGIINTIDKYSERQYIREIDVVIVDECHRVKFRGMYENVLKNCPAPVRLGLTATPPNPYDDAARVYALEGLIGPIISKVALEELSGRVLAEPRVKLIKLPRKSSVRELRKYQEVYQKGVVENRLLNKRVCDEARGLVLNEKLSVLIIVKRIEHGNIIHNMLRSLYPQDFRYKFLQGETDAQEREKIRLELDKGNLDIAITTPIWKEGVDIPSLGAIVNAAGGKEEIPTLQWLGRGMRKPKGKEELIIVDFFDESHHYLVSHFGNRVCLYYEKGWIR